MIGYVGMHEITFILRDKMLMMQNANAATLILFCFYRIILYVHSNVLLILLNCYYFGCLYVNDKM